VELSRAAIFEGVARRREECRAVQYERLLPWTPAIAAAVPSPALSVMTRPGHAGGRRRGCSVSGRPASPAWPSPRTSPTSPST